MSSVFYLYSNDSLTYRLGIGEMGKVGDYEHKPSRVPTFSLLKLKVLSVSCGGLHNLALTDRGVRLLQALIKLISRLFIFIRY